MSMYDLEREHDDINGFVAAVRDAIESTAGECGMPKMTGVHYEEAPSGKHFLYIGCDFIKGEALDEINLSMSKASMRLFSIGADIQNLCGGTTLLQYQYVPDEGNFTLKPAEEPEEPESYEYPDDEDYRLEPHMPEYEGGSYDPVDIYGND